MLLFEDPKNAKVTVTGLKLQFNNQLIDVPCSIALDLSERYEPAELEVSVHCDDHPLVLWPFRGQQMTIYSTIHANVLDGHFICAVEPVEAYIPGQISEVTIQALKRVQLNSYTLLIVDGATTGEVIISTGVYF